MRSALKQNLSSEMHEALGDAFRICVENMGPRQRREVAKELASAAGDYEGRPSRLLLKLALYVEPAR